MFATLREKWCTSSLDQKTYLASKIKGFEPPQYTVHIFGFQLLTRYDYPLQWFGTTVGSFFLCVDKLWRYKTCVFFIKLPRISISESTFQAEKD
jgi:hypothetical protein